MILTIVARDGFKFDVEGYPRATGHLSECFLVTAADLGWNVDPNDYTTRCTCDDWYPE